MISDYTMSDEECQLISRLLYQHTGICLGLRKKALLMGRLSQRLIRRDVPNFYKYYRLVLEDPEELKIMIERVSTHTTMFMREAHHFKYLGETILPELFERRRMERSLRIWSSACSTGEEPYSIAITVLETLERLGIEPESWDVKVLASDIAGNVLDRADAGRYKKEQIPEFMGRELVSKYFKEEDGLLSARQSIRNLIKFRSLNLTAGPYPFSKPFDIIFCRNVLIYFDDETKQKVVEKLERSLAPDGYLFLGHSETLFGYRNLKNVFVTTYRKQDAVNA